MLIFLIKKNKSIFLKVCYKIEVKIANKTDSVFFQSSFL